MTLSVGTMPSGDQQWKDAILFIKEHLPDIMRICNQQCGPNAKDELNADDSTFLWYAYIANHIIELKKEKMIA